MNAADTTTKTHHDWTRADALTDAQVHETALTDPDALPITDED